jgi:hypothetical protein
LEAATKTAAGEADMSTLQQAVNRSETLEAAKARRAELEAELRQVKSIEKAEKTRALGVSEYKGHAVLTLALDNGKTFTFGRSKAKCVIDNITTIKAFYTAAAAAAVKPAA